MPELEPLNDLRPPWWTRLRTSPLWSEEGGLTLLGAVLLVVVGLATLLAPWLAPYDPNRTVGGSFVPPGKGQILLVVRKGSPLQGPQDLGPEVRLGVLVNSTGAFWAEAEGLEPKVYPSPSKLFGDLVGRRARLDAVLVDAYDERVANFLRTYRRQVQVVGDPFGPRFLLGTDGKGFDVFSRLLWGGRTIFQVALLSALFSALVGVPLGLLSGFWGGLPDRVLSLVMDSIYSFPGLILAIAMAAMLGPGILNIAIAIAVVYIPTYFRLSRGQTLAVKAELYVEAARALGARARTVLWRYVFPNVIPSIVVVFSLNIADAILTEAGLSFLGLGLPPDIPDWGFDLNRGKGFLPSGYWWIITFPGLAIALVALGFSLLGEGLGEILNPRLRD